MTSDLALPKMTALRAIQSLPDNSSLEDIIESLCFVLDVEEGLRDSENGRFVSDDEVVRKFDL